MCEGERDVRPVISSEEYEVRGEKIRLDVPRLVCQTCNEQMVDESFGDVTLHLYAEYRCRHNLLTSEQIRGTREKYRLSQESLATLLGTSPATLARYETGSIQDKAYDQLLRACDNPVFMADLLAREGRNLSPRQRQNAMTAVESLKASVALAAFPECHMLNLAKYAAVATWFCSRIDTIVQTKMNKLLFYSDFIAHHAFGQSITGSSYWRLQHGPVPCRYQHIQGVLEEQEFIEMREVIFPNYEGLAYEPGPEAPRPADVLTTDELRVLEFVYQTFGKLNAGQISDRSHKESAWLETALKGIISYAHASRLSVSLPR